MLITAYISVLKCHSCEIVSVKHPIKVCNCNPMLHHAAKLCYNCITCTNVIWYGKQKSSLKTRHMEIIQGELSYLKYNYAQCSKHPRRFPEYYQRKT